MSRRPINPFYPLLIAVSVIFVVTACAYGVMALRAISPTATSGPHPLLAFLDRHGMLLLMVEVAALAAMAVLAMSTDRYWTERGARAPQIDHASDEEKNRMKVNHFEQAEKAAVAMEGAVGCQMRRLLGPEDGTPTFAMRQFEVAPGGHTPCHSHPFEHEVFVLEGQGVVLEGEREHPLAAGDVVFVVPGEIHQFRNTGEQPLKFLCLVPNSAMTPAYAASVRLADACTTTGGAQRMN